MRRSLTAAWCLALASLYGMIAAGAALGGHASHEAAHRPLAQRGEWAVYAGCRRGEAEVMFLPDALWDGQLVYVDARHPLPGGASGQQARNVRKLVGLYVPCEADVSLAQPLIYALCALVTDNPLLHATVSAGVRSPGEQARLQNEAFLRCLATLPAQEALAQARAEYPDAGTGEHQLAWAFDIRLEGALDWSQSDPLARNADGLWLLENAWRYGIIRRYPPQKAAITGVAGEGAHMRYVGKTHAAAMHIADLCLEEYLRLLHEEGGLTLYCRGEIVACVQCVPLEGGAVCFKLPDCEGVEVSADNLGYAVCAYKPL